MAYQPKSYKKFVATAATATLVASAVAPMASAAFTDVADRYKEAVDYLATEGIAQGYPNGKFGTDDKIKRQDAAVMIARVLGATPDGNYVNAGFTDVPADRQWAVNFLAEKKIVSGKAAGRFGANDFTQRDEMAKIIAGAYELVADDTNAFPFTDVSETFKQYVDALNEAGIAQGYENSTRFGSGDMVTRGQFALFIHRAEGSPVATPKVAVSSLEINEEGNEFTLVFEGALPENADVAWLAENYEILINGKAATEAQLTALDLKIKSVSEDRKTVVVSHKDLDELGLEGTSVELSIGGAKDTYTFETVVAPVVESVTATNLKTVTVKFNKEVNEDTLSSSTISTKVNGVTTASTVTLSEDGMSAVLTYADGAMTQSDKLTITVDGVETIDGVEFPVTTKELTVVDTTLPEALSAQVVNAKKVTLFFSEPVNFSTPAAQVLSNVKINGSNVIAKVVANPATNSVDLEFPTALPVGNHTLTVSDVMDFANFKIAPKTFAISVLADSAAPAATSAQAISRNSIVVTFNEEVSNLGSFKVNGTTVTANRVAGSANKVELTGFNLGISAIVEVSVKYSGQTDAVGNTVTTEQEIKFNVADDTTLPTATATVSSAASSLNKVTLNFSKPMQNVGTITVKDAAGNTKATLDLSALSFKANTNNTVLELTAAQAGLNNVDPGTFTINLKGLKDNTIRENGLAEVNLTVNAFDTKVPTVANRFVLTTNTDTTKNTVRITFSEAMNADTLRNLSNIGVDFDGTTGGTSYTPLSTISGASVASISADGKSVTYVVPNVTSAAEFQVISAVRDVAGNAIATTGSIAAANTGTGGSELLSVSSARAINANTIEITTTAPLTSIDPSSFALEFAGGGAAFTFANAVIDSSDNTKARLTVNGTMANNTEIYRLVTSSTAAQRELTTSVYDGKLVADTDVVTDAIRPTLVSVVSGDVIDGDAVVEANTFTVSFSEAVVAGTGNFNTLLGSLVVSGTGTNGSVQLSAGDFTVTSGKNGTGTTAANVYTGDKFAVELTTSGIAKLTSDTVTVSVLQNGLVDTAAAPNPVVASSAFTVNADVTAAPAAVTTADLTPGTNAGTTRLTGVNNTMEYRINGASWNAITTSTVDNLAANNGDTIDVRVASRDGVAAGATAPLNVVYADIKPAAAPTGVAATAESAAGANDGTITGVNDTMEYRLVGASSFSPVASAATSITGLADGTYEVRVQQTATKPASEAVSVTVVPGA